MKGTLSQTAETTLNGRHTEIKEQTGNFHETLLSLTLVQETID